MKIKEIRLKNHVITFEKVNNNYILFFDSQRFFDSENYEEVNDVFFALLEAERESETHEKTITIN